MKAAQETQADDARCFRGNEGR